MSFVGTLEGMLEQVRGVICWAVSDRNRLMVNVGARFHMSGI